MLIDQTVTAHVSQADEPHAIRVAKANPTIDDLTPDCPTIATLNYATAEELK